MAFKNRSNVDKFDYKTLQALLTRSNLQTDNPPLFQMLSQIVLGSQKFRNGIADRIKIGDSIDARSQLTDMVPIANGGGLTGQYAPSFTLGTNVGGAGFDEFYWTRVGSFVNVDGKIQINVTGLSLNTELRISLPILSYFQFSYQCVGIGHSDTVNQTVAIQADPINDVALVKFLSTANGIFDLYLHFMYKVVAQ